MNYDKEKLRKLLLTIDQQVGSRPRVPEVEGMNPDEVYFHCQLSLDENLVEGEDISTMDQSDIMVHRLTSAGHQFANAAASDDRWFKIFKKGGDLIGTATDLAITAAVKGFVKSQVE